MVYMRNMPPKEVVFLPVKRIPCRFLDLADCRGLSGESLRAILCGSSNLGQLEGLTVDGIAEVDDQLLTEVCLALPQLSRLSLRFCSLVTDTGEVSYTRCDQKL